MAGGKQTPRQKLIGMMYLVLMAMLALNVSTEVLKSFLVVNEGIVRTNINFEKKVESAYTLFERALAENKDKVRPYFDKAMEARRLTTEFRGELKDLRTELISMATRTSPEVAAEMDPRNIRRQDDKDTPSRLFISLGKGAELREKIEVYVANMLELIPEEERARIVSPFDVTGPFHDAGGTKVSWEVANFSGAIIVAAITILNKLENDAMNLELDVVNELFRLVAAGDFTFDDVQARIVPRSNFVALGETFEAEIFLVAFDSRTRIAANVNGQTLVSRDGVIEFRSPTSREGLHTVSGWIDLGDERFPFRTEYVVAAPAGSVSADAMNVFYIGVDNPITAAVSGVEPGNVRVSVSGAGASIHPIAGSGNRHIIRATTPGQATVTLQAGARTVGTFNYRVKRVPDPVVIANGIDRHQTTVDRATLAASGGLLANIPDFEFDLRTPVVSFTMVTTVGGEFVEQRATGARFTDQMTALINNARRGQRFSFENIVVQMPTGNQAARNFTLTIR